MKAILIQLLAISFFHFSLLAGEAVNSGKDTPASEPCPHWYADNEWNVSLWATYAATDNDYPTLENTVSTGIFALPINSGSLGSHDTYLGSDHAWGGGIDAKYFLKRYFGFGLEAWAMDARRSFGTVTLLPTPPGAIGSRLAYGTGHDERLVGALLGTFTLRYPLGCSRFAPYAWAGGGAIFGGGELDEAIVNDIPAGAVISRFHRGNETKAIGQFGAGFEVRLTPHIGWTNDFSWNVIDGSTNNFGMVRSGLNFAF